MEKSEKLEKLEKFRKPEQNNLTESIEKYRNTVFQIALGYVKNIHDADDIAQNVFMKLYNSNKNFDTAEKEKAWLIRVTINEAKDLLKSVWRKRRADLDESMTAPENGDLSLYEYVKALKPKYRTVIFLFYYEGYSSKEIAEILKIPQSTVTTRLKRAREQLKSDITSEEALFPI